MNIEERIEFPIGRYGATEKTCPMELPKGHKCRECVWRDRTNARLLCGFAVCVKDKLTERQNE